MALGRGLSTRDGSYFLDEPRRAKHIAPPWGGIPEGSSSLLEDVSPLLPVLEYVEDFEYDDDDNDNPDDIERVHDYLFSFTVSFTVMLFSTLRTLGTLRATSPARLFWSLLSAKPLN